MAAYGTDANALISMGAENVFSTDISDKLLEIGNDCGFINEYAAENAEQLSFDNEQFDFVLCKEAYHHFPRPHIALHEMLRVCKVGVVLMEPNDALIDGAPLSFIVTIIKRLLRRKSNSSGHDFEPVGNYVFSISSRELEKFQLGMHRRFLAYKHINDYYESGFEFIHLNTSRKSEKFKIFKTKVLISLRSFMVRLGLLAPSLKIAILFKNHPDEKLLATLKSYGWQIKKSCREILTSKSVSMCS